MHAPTQQDPPARLTRRELQMVFAGLMMAMALAALDQNIVSTALPRIVSELGGLAHLSWVVTAFMLASTMTTPLYGKLSDMYGRKPLFMVAIGSFLVGSVLCGMAQAMGQLIGFRLVQGLGAGGLMTLAQTTIGDVLEPRERPKYQGLFTGVWAVCSVAGPLLGGFLTSALSWRWIFYVNLPVGAAALFLISIGLKGGHRKVKHQLDYLGIVLLMASTTAIMLVLSWGGAEYAWTSPLILSLAAVGVALAFALIVQEGRAPEPILSLDMFRQRVFTIGATVTGLNALSLFGVMVFMSLYFQLVVGVEPYESGLLLAPQIGGLICASVFGGAVVTRTGRYKIFLVCGAAAVSLSMIGMAFFTSRDLGVWPIEVCLFAMGLGMGCTMPNLTVAVQNAVQRDRLGQATSVLSFMRSLGGALGVSLFGGLMTATFTSSLAARVVGIDADALLKSGVQNIAALPAIQKAAVIGAYHDAIGTVFLVGAVITAAAFFVVLLMPELPLRTRDPVEDAEMLLE